MTKLALVAMPGLTQHVLDLGGSFSAADWTRPTGCPGWSVHDLFVHLTCTFREVADREGLPDPVPGSIERSNDVAVAAFRHRAPEENLADYRDLVAPALEEMARQQEGEAAQTSVDLDDAGVYPAHLMADSLVFDHYCHLKVDLTFSGAVLPRFEGDEAVMGSSLAWLLAGLPQMSPPRLGEAVQAPVALTLTGAGGGTWTLRRTTAGVEVVEGDHGAAARISSAGEQFLRWGTHRVHWSEADLTIDGDRTLARAVADSIKVF